MPGHIINVSRLTRKLRSVWGLRGEDFPTDADDIRGYIGLEMDRPEWAFAGGERLMWGGFSLAAVAAQFTVHQLFNPLNSGVISVIRRVSILTSPAALTLWRMTDVALAAGVFTGIVARDTRVGVPDAGGNTISTLLFRSNNQVAAPGGSVARTHASEEIEVDIVLAPGGGITWQCSIVNTGLDVNFIGYERPQEAGRLS